MNSAALSTAASAADTIRIQLREIAQLFNSIDPSPFHERDLDSEAERFIVSWARDLPSNAKLSLRIEVAQPPRSTDFKDTADAIHAFFMRQSAMSRRELRTLMRRGRINLIIGMLFLALCVVAGDTAARSLGASLGAIIQNGLMIVGWVAMWRPMEIFLYDWWPLIGDRRLYDRLALMPVEIQESPASPMSAGEAEARSGTVRG